MQTSLTLAVLIAGLPALMMAQSGHRWVATWGTAQQMHKGVGLPGPRPNAPQPASPDVPHRRFGIPPTLEAISEQTVRMVVRASIGGSAVRIRLANALGSSAVRIGAARIAMHRTGSEIDAASDRQITFGGNPSVMLYGGAIVVSDPVRLPVAPLRDLAISLYIPGNAPSPTTHLFGLRTTYLSRGAATASPFLPDATTTESYYWLAGVDVLAPADAGTVVAFGDSITDGDQSAPNSIGAWPSILAERLQTNKATAKLGVVNAGIAGNRLLGDGPTGVVRLLRDGLSHPGVQWLMILEGINDITGATRQGSTSTMSEEDLIQGYKQIVETAHLYGVKVVGCTITPYGGSGPFNKRGEAIRHAVNTWIRTSGMFDAVVDFDAATRDAADPTRFRKEADSPDLLHPGNGGYRIMAEAVDLSIFMRKTQRERKPQ